MKHTVKPKPLLVISNGAGEDSIAAQVIRNLPPECSCQVMPLVGCGDAYRGVAELVGPRQNMPSGGLNILRDLRGGLLGLIVRQLWWLVIHKHEYSKIVAVGDLWPVLLAVCSGIRPVIFIGTAKSDYYHPYSKLEAWVLRTFEVYSVVRDEPTAASLRQKGCQAVYVGNAMMDGLEPQKLNFSLNPQELGLALFPGSRQAAYKVLPRLLELTHQLSVHLGRPICGFIAAAPSIDIKRLAGELSGRQIAETDYPGWLALSSSENVRFFLIKDHLADVLKYSQVALGLAGTAHEQAAGWGIPVVAYERGGAKNLRWYRARQKGLLGEALIVTEDRDSDIVEALSLLCTKPEERERRGAVGRERLGAPGGAQRMARIISEGQL